MIWRWCARFWMIRWLGGGALKRVSTETGYKANTCLTRVLKLLPPVITADASAALIAELECRVAESQEVDP